MNVASPVSPAFTALVAEQSEIITQILTFELRARGADVTVCTNGRDALHAWRSGCHDLLLTGLCLRYLDGFELVTAIRREEDPSGRIAIVAIDISGDLEQTTRCVDAGMDYCIRMPLDVDQLNRVLSRWPRRCNGGAAGPARAPKAAMPVLDTSTLTRITGSDRARLEDLLLRFRRSAARTLDEMQVADMPAMPALAHRLKSSARAVGALALGELCEQLEHADNTSAPLRLAQTQAAIREVLCVIDARTD